MYKYRITFDGGRNEGRLESEYICMCVSSANLAMCINVHRGIVNYEYTRMYSILVMTEDELLLISSKSHSILDYSCLRALMYASNE